MYEQLLILCIIICHLAGAGARLTVQRSDLSRTGLRVFLYKDQLPGSCSFIDSNALKTLGEKRKQAENNIL